MIKYFTNEPKPLCTQASRGTQLFHTSTHVARQSRSPAITTTQVKIQKNATHGLSIPCYYDKFQAIMHITRHWRRHMKIHPLIQ